MAVFASPPGAIVWAARRNTKSPTDNLTETDRACQRCSAFFQIARCAVQSDLEKSRYKSGQRQPTSSNHISPVSLRSKMNWMASTAVTSKPVSASNAASGSR